MSASRRTNGWATMAALGLSLLATSGMTGIQSQANGQIPPSPYYMQDDVKYFPAGPEFKVSKEAAARKAAHAEQSTQREVSSPTPPQMGPYRYASPERQVESLHAKRGKMRRQDRQRFLCRFLHAHLNNRHAIGYQ